MNTTENDFLTQIRADRRDRHSRLVFADWLQDHGRPLDAALQRVLAEPESDERRLEYAAALPPDMVAAEYEFSPGLAEFIRVQVALAKVEHLLPPGTVVPIGMNELTPEMTLARAERRIITDYACCYFRSVLPVPEEVGAWGIGAERHIRNMDDHGLVGLRRGFAHSVHCQADTWLDLGDTLCDLQPIARVRLRGRVRVVPQRDPANRRIVWRIADRKKTLYVSAIAAALDARWHSGEYPKITLDLLRLEWPGILFELPDYN